MLQEYFNKWKKYLLQEGKLEQETTVIVREIMKIVKEFLEKTENRYYADTLKLVGLRELEKKYALKNVGSIDYFFVNVYKGQTEKEIPVVSGELTVKNMDGKLKKIIDIFIHVKKHFSTKDKNLEELVFNLKKTVRHELEHSLQDLHSDFLHNFLYPRGDVHLDTPEELMKYYTSQHEVEAFVSGIYKKAKSSKMPFTKVLNKFLDGVREFFNSVQEENNPNGPYYKTKEQIERFVQSLRIKYIEYAKKRFPNAIMDDEGIRIKRN